MNFILPFKIEKSTHPIGYDQQIMSVGSCFAEEIGKLMQEQLFNVLLNPHGILFNSISICDALNDYIINKKYTAESLVNAHGLWHSLNHHGKFSHENEKACLEQINGAIAEAHQFLKHTNWLCITLGSSWAFKYHDTKNIVANCHKLPQQKFTRILLDAEEQTSALLNIIQNLKVFNPNLRIIFTISPVKYLRDGVVENNLGKAQLFTTVHNICNQHDHCEYFPAYELVTDVLRDYRFYKEDLMHPNEQAIRYVWDRFIETYLNEADKLSFEFIKGWNKFAEHTPLSENSRASHLKRSEEMKTQIEKELNSRRMHSRPISEE